jgi:hypothetical protein
MLRRLLRVTVLPASSLAAAVMVSHADAQSVLSAVSSSLSYFAAQVKLAATFSAPAVPVNFGNFG